VAGERAALRGGASVFLVATALLCALPHSTSSSFSSLRSSSLFAPLLRRSLFALPYPAAITYASLLPRPSSVLLRPPSSSVVLPPPSSSAPAPLFSPFLSSPPPLPLGDSLALLLLSQVIVLRPLPHTSASPLAGAQRLHSIALYCTCSPTRIVRTATHSIRNPRIHPPAQPSAVAVSASPPTPTTGTERKGKKKSPPLSGRPIRFTLSARSSP